MSSPYVLDGVQPRCTASARPLPEVKGRAEALRREGAVEPVDLPVRPGRSGRVRWGGARDVAARDVGDVGLNRCGAVAARLLDT